MTSLLVTPFLNQPELIWLHIIIWFQVFLFNTNSFIYKQLNSFKHCYIILIVQFIINHLFEHS